MTAGRCAGFREAIQVRLLRSSAPGAQAHAVEREFCGTVRSRPHQAMKGLEYRAWSLRPTIAETNKIELVRSGGRLSQAVFQANVAKSRGSVARLSARKYGLQELASAGISVWRPCPFCNQHPEAAPRHSTVGYDSCVRP